MRMPNPGLTSRTSVKSTTRISCRSLWIKFSVTSEKKSMLDWTSEKVPRKEELDKALKTQVPGPCPQGHRRQSAFDRLSDTYLPSITKSRLDRANSRDRSHKRSRPHRRDSSNRDRPRSMDCSRGVEESYDNSCSSYGMGTKHGYHSRDKDHSRYVKRGRESESPLSRRSESGTSGGGHWKSKSKRHKPTDEDDLASGLGLCDRGDPEDHVKNFQAAAQVERWAMPTWFHMLNSTLIGAARVWFDELPPKSIDGYKDLKAAFLAYFMQQKKYVKDPVEIHNIKQRDEETIEEFMEQFKVETGRMKGAPECMRISEFMHGVNNSELTKRLNEHVPKTMEEMMITTTAFIWGEAAAIGKKKGHTSWRTQDQSKRHGSERRSDFRGQPRDGWGSSKFTPLTRTPKEILATEAGKFKPPPPMGRGQPKVGKKEVPAKYKSMAIYIIQPWHRMTRHKVTQSFKRISEITFPSLTTSNGTEGSLVIEAEIGGHMIHRMYIDGGSSTELELPQELSRVHNTFHVSNLKKCYSDEPLAVPLEGLHVDDKLCFVEEPVEIMDREVKRLKQSRIPIVKVRWNSRRGPEFTWEREDQFQKKYPHLFTKPVPSSSVAT
ncbi:reverse transcriptase domain-containing protein [Tanacetum coccineum]